MANTNPDAVNDAVVVNGITPFVISPLVNDVDVENDPLTITSVGSPVRGTVTNNGNGTLTYTPSSNLASLTVGQSVTDFFFYTISDGVGGFDTAAVLLTLNGINDAPVALNDTYSATEGQALTVAAAGVLGNDSDVDNGATLTAVLVSGPSGGTLTFNPNGSFTYTANVGFSGIDSFTYVANDGTANSNVATVTLNVTDVNFAPTAVNDVFTVAEDSLGTSLNVLANDTDPDRDALTLQGFSNLTPGAGTLTQNNDGTFTFVPSPSLQSLKQGQSSQASFNYTIQDAAGVTSTASVTLTIQGQNDAPTAVVDNFTGQEGSPLEVSATNGVLSNDGDVDGDSLTARLVSNPQNGTLTFNPDGSFRYIPNAGFSGVDSFQYAAGDGLAETPTTVLINIADVNFPPAAGNDVASTTQDAPIDINVLSNDSDPDGDPLVVTPGTPSQGSVTNNAGVLTYTPGTSLRSLDSGETATDSFTYTITDRGNQSATGTVTVTITGVNDAPVAAGDQYSATQGSPLTVSAGLGVLANDSDVDVEPLTVALVNGPTNGSLVFNNDGSFVYTPNIGFSGTDSFSYVANDGDVNSNVATVTIGVGDVNFPPVAGGDAVATTEDAAVEIPVLLNDTDLDSDPLQVTALGTPTQGTVTNNGGVLTYTPSPSLQSLDVGQTVTDSFTYTISDPSGSSSTGVVTVTVNGANDPPVAADNPYSATQGTPLNVPLAQGVLGNDSDVDGDRLTAVLVNGPANGSLLLNADGSFSYTPNASFSGTDSFTYVANDGDVNSNVATVSISVADVNFAPTAVNDTVATTEDAGVAIAILSNDTDPDGDILQVVSLGTPTQGSVTNNNGVLTYTPASNLQSLDDGESLVDSFTYTVADSGGLTSTATVTVTVTGVNDAPVGTADGFAGTGAIAGNVLTNDTDVDGEALTASVLTAPASGILVLNPDGSFVYTPTSGFVGVDGFTYVASDGTAPSQPVSVTLTVTSTPNLPPIAASDDATTTAETPVSIAVLANDSDPDGDPLSFTLTTLPTNGTVTLNDSGTPNPSDDWVVYTPAVGFCGTDSFTYTISDGKGGTSSASATISVLGGVFTGTAGSDTLSGTNCPDLIDGQGGADTITGGQGSDTLTGGGGQDTFIINEGDGVDIITDFGGVGRGTRQDAATIAQVDTIRFVGATLSARNLLAKQMGVDLELSFEGVANTKVVLQNFTLDNLDNLLTTRGANADLSNLQFVGQTTHYDSFDVINADSSQRAVFNRNTVTFLNDLDNDVLGYDNSEDVINAQGGNDRLHGFGGDDLLRGGNGNDSLAGGAGDDRLVGEEGLDQFVYDTGRTFVTTDIGIDTISDFTVGSDKIVLDKTTFRALTSAAGNGFSNATEFAVVGSDAEAATSSAHIVFNNSNGRLFYNANGSANGLGTGAAIATLTNTPGLTSADFIIQL